MDIQKHPRIFSSSLPLYQSHDSSSLLLIPPFHSSPHSLSSFLKLSFFLSHFFNLPTETWNSERVSATRSRKHCLNGATSFSPTRNWRRSWNSWKPPPNPRRNARPNAQGSMRTCPWRKSTSGTRSNKNSTNSTPSSRRKRKSASLNWRY